MPSFGENLRELRKSRGYSQDRFARLLGSNQMTLSSWECGTRMPSLDTIKHIANTFHVSVTSLISVEESGHEDDLVYEIADLFNTRPMIRTLFECSRYLSDKDLGVLVGVAQALTKETNTK